MNRRKISAALALALAATAVSAVPAQALAAPAVVAASDPYAGTISQDSNFAQVSTIFRLTNEARAKAGLPPVKFSAPVSAVSQGWSTKIAATNNFNHNPSFSTQMPTGWTWAAENLAMIGSSDLTASRNASQLFTNWMNSPGHRANILSPQANVIGIGVTFVNSLPNNSSMKGMYGVQNFGHYNVMPAGTFDSPEAWKASVTGTTVPKPAQSLTIATAGTKKINYVTYAWGKGTGLPVGTQVCTQVLIGTKWSQSQCSKLDASGNYTIKLTYGAGTPGTYKWRVRAANGTLSPVATLTRVR